ncbi:MAG: NAD-dependent epimerase/dehydratase family protein [Oceanococcus sp.]|nr:MAG: NAD-dependent epimerase/dehydratase family protein [Oceanococcus sp.]
MPVQALSRDFSGKDTQALSHLTEVVGDLDKPDSLPQISGRVIISAPPPREGEHDPRMSNLIAALLDVEVVVYISTSGVYGDCAGQRIDEQQPPAPLTERAKRRLDAELQLQGWAARSGARLAILRVPGIYGPGRLPEQRLREGRPVLDPAQAPVSNRIHAEDLAQALWLAAEHGDGVYNISDGTPDSMSLYFLRVAEHLGLPQPPLVDWDEAQRTFSPALLSFYRESRQLDIRKGRRELGFEPRYANLSAGLKAC